MAALEDNDKVVLIKEGEKKTTKPYLLNHLCVLSASTSGRLRGFSFSRGQAETASFWRPGLL